MGEEKEGDSVIEMISSGWEKIDKARGWLQVFTELLVKGNLYREEYLPKLQNIAKNADSEAGLLRELLSDPELPIHAFRLFVVQMDEFRNIASEARIRIEKNAVLHAELGEG